MKDKKKNENKNGAPYKVNEKAIFGKTLQVHERGVCFKNSILCT